jgi:hypothetical protein
MPARRAAVLAAALHHWSTATRDAEPTAGRLVVREAPDWQHLGTQDLTRGQITRLLGLLRDDLAIPTPTTPVQAGAAVDQILAEWRAERRRTIRPADWIAVLPRIGRDHAWLAAHLVHLADAGYLRETRRPGTYRL